MALSLRPMFEDTSYSDPFPFRALVSSRPDMLAQLSPWMENATRCNLVEVRTVVWCLWVCVPSFRPANS